MRVTIFAVFLLLVPLASFSEDDFYRHMVTFGRQGFGWSGSYEEIDSEADSEFKQVQHIFNDFAFNYAYRFTNRFQLGLFFLNNHFEYRFESKNGNTSQSEIEETVFGGFAIYNFKSEIDNSFYTGIALSQFNYEDEKSHDFADSEGKNPLEMDNSGYTLELIFGKRFSLSRFKIEHLTYSPNITFFIRDNGKDFKDQSIIESQGVNIQAIKFDLLF